MLPERSWQATSGWRWVSSHTPTFLLYSHTGTIKNEGKNCLKILKPEDFNFCHMVSFSRQTLYWEGGGGGVCLAQSIVNLNLLNKLQKCWDKNDFINKHDGFFMLSSFIKVPWFRIPGEGEEKKSEDKVLIFRTLTLLLFIIYAE